MKPQRLARTDIYTVIGYKGERFAIISNDDLLPEVLAVADGGFSTTTMPDGMEWWLKAVEKSGEAIVKSGRAMSPVVPNPDRYATQVQPLISSEWGQDKPYNDQCPISHSTDTHSTGRSATGCVATAMSQIMKYYKYPLHGQGTATTTTDVPNTPNRKWIYTVDFSTATYDWDNMLDHYAGVDYSKVQGDAVALLMYHTGMAAKMQYSPDGSGAYTADAATALRDNFLYASTVRVCTRSSYDMLTWMDLVYTELNASRPILYTGNDAATGYGHAFVIDGYQSDGLVHVNWGWEGTDDGYFDISLLNPSSTGMSFVNYQDMIIGIQTTEPERLTADVTLDEPGSLISQLNQDKTNNYSSLKVSGNVNGTDLRLLRNMAGVDEKGHGTLGSLSKLDLSGARFVSGGDAYLVDSDKQLTTSADSLPERAFYNAQALDTVNLPAIKHIGDGAFGLCTSLHRADIKVSADADFKLSEGIVSNLSGNEIIEVLPYKKGSVEFSDSVKSLHPYALAGCKGVNKVILPSSLVTIGKKAFASCYNLVEIRSGLTTPPTVSDDAFDDMPVSTCKLYVPAGSKKAYRKAEGWKKFVGTTADGSSFDNILEYGICVEARNKTREYGEENPEFTYKVSGDTPTGEPVLTCEATPSSPVGKYAIVPNRGTITDPDVYFVNGTLVVTPASLTVKADDATRAVGQPNPQFTIRYEGFKNNETSDVLSELPVATCEATADSPIGDYPIYVSGGKASNYTLSYVAGVLHVVSIADGISTISTQQSSDEYYDLSGRKLTKPSQGICIIRDTNGNAHKLIK